MLGGSCQACALCVPVSQLCQAGPLHTGYPAWNTCSFRRSGVGDGGAQELLAVTMTLLAPVQASSSHLTCVAIVCRATFPVTGGETEAHRADGTH